MGKQRLGSGLNTFLAPILQLEGSLFFECFMLTNDQIARSTIALQVKRGRKEGVYESKMEWSCQFYHHGL